MTECQFIDIRDQLPDYVHGTLEPSVADQVAAHVELCAECAEELDLLRQFVAAAAPASVSDADIARIALAIAPYGNGAFAGATSSTSHPSVSNGSDARVRKVAGRARGSFPLRWWQGRPVQLAAGVLIAAAGISTVVMTRDKLSPSMPAVATQQGSVTAAPSGVALVGVSGLSDENLAQLIDAMDDIEAVPVVTSEPVVPQFVGAI